MYNYQLERDFLTLILGPRLFDELGLYGSSSSSSESKSLDASQNSFEPNLKSL